MRKMVLPSLMARRSITHIMKRLFDNYEKIDTVLESKVNDS